MPKTKNKRASARLKAAWIYAGTFAFFLVGAISFTVAHLKYHFLLVNVPVTEAVLAELWVTSFFGATVGFAALLVAVTRPEEASFDDRVSWLYTRHREITNGAWEYLRIASQSNAGIVTTGESTIDVLEGIVLPGGKQAFKLRFEHNYSIFNAMQELECPCPVDIWVEPDDVGTDLLGEIESMQFYLLPDDGRPAVESEGRRPLKRGAPFRFAKRIKIPAAGGLRYRYSYWAWMIGDIPWRFESARYAENQDILLRNRLPNGDATQILVNCYYGGPGEEIKPKSFTVDPGQSLFLMKDSVLHPGWSAKRFSFTLRVPRLPGQP